MRDVTPAKPGTAPGGGRSPLGLRGSLSPLGQDEAMASGSMSARSPAGGVLEPLNPGYGDGSSTSRSLGWQQGVSPWPQLQPSATVGVAGPGVTVGPSPGVATIGAAGFLPPPTDAQTSSFVLTASKVQRRPLP
jgi:hypothetical protein